MSVGLECQSNWNLCCCAIVVNHSYCLIVRGVVQGRARMGSANATIVCASREASWTRARPLRSDSVSTRSQPRTTFGRWRTAHVMRLTSRRPSVLFITLVCATPRTSLQTTVTRLLRPLRRRPQLNRRFQCNEQFQPWRRSLATVDRRKRWARCRLLEHASRRHTRAVRSWSARPWASSFITFGGPCFYFQPHGANMTCETVHIALKHLESTYGSIPAVVYIQLDNCGDNKCGTVLAYLYDLRRRGCLRKVAACVLIVGHTHIDVSPRFGTISVHIF